MHLSTVALGEALEVVKVLLHGNELNGYLPREDKKLLYRLHRLQVRQIHDEFGWNNLREPYSRVFAMSKKCFCHDEISEDCWKDQMRMTVRENQQTRPQLKEWMRYALPLIVFELEETIEHRQLFWNLVQHYNRTMKSYQQVFVSSGISGELLAIRNTLQLHRKTDIEDFVRGISQSRTRVIGLDFEWCSNSRSSISLAQISLKDGRVYLLNMHAVKKAFDASELRQLTSGQAIFTTNNRVVIAFGMGSDLTQLRNSGFTSWADILQNHDHLIMLEHVQRYIKQKNLEKYVYNYVDDKNGKSKSLSSLVFALFGKNLDKRERLSDWDRVPLRPAQVAYAALDACCLIQIRKVLIAKCISCMSDAECALPKALLLPIKKLLQYLERGSSRGIE